ncbi:MAG: AAA family ATPase [Pseudomonadota bacterium]
MRRVMIIGQPGSGKSTLARRMGAITKLPVIHIDHIHWKPGWVERPGPEKDRLCAEVHARDAWIFEGGHSATWPERLSRADTLIWLDLSLRRRAVRVAARTLRHWGRVRPDLPAGCPEQFSVEFYSFIWRTRHSARARMAALYETTPPGTAKHRLSSPAAVRRYLEDLSRAAASGNLGIPHR